MAEPLRVTFHGIDTRCAECNFSLTSRWDEEREVLLLGCATQGCRCYGRHGVWPSNEFRLVSREEEPCETQTKELATC